MKPSSAAVLRLLEDYGSAGVTPRDAVNDAGCWRLAARIADLRADGYVIASELETYEGRRYARYRLVIPPFQEEFGL